jgi:phage anti-repressor protein
VKKKAEALVIGALYIWLDMIKEMDMAKRTESTTH